MNPRRPVARYLGAQELERLGAVLDCRRDEHPWHVAALRLLSLTGARLSEVLNLRWDEIGDLSARDGGGARLPDTKTGPRTLWFGPDAAKLVSSLPRRGEDVSNIVTNPPYHSAEGFVASGLENAERKFALLLRLAFLEGANRARTIFHQRPPSRVWVFSERITFYQKGAQRAGSGTTAYAWFVWDKDHLGGTELAWFKPGYKARYKTN